MDLKPYTTKVPRPILIAIWKYFEKHQPLGPFLKAVIENNFRAAVLLADDAGYGCLRDLAVIVANELPIECHGSPKAYAAWVRKVPKVKTPVVIPEGLAGDKFTAVWGEWIAARRERNHPCTPRTLNAQLKKLSAMGMQRAILAIENSIASGYQGIFEPDKPKPEKAAQPLFDDSDSIAEHAARRRQLEAK